MSAIEREARDRTEAERLAALGHKPQWDGHCEHRWRNRTSRAVHCRFLDGWREGRAFGAPLLIDAAPALPAGLPDVETLAAALYDELAVGSFDGRGPGHPHWRDVAKRILAALEGSATHE